MSKRYIVGFTEDEFQGHRGVTWTVYRTGRLSEAEYREFIKPPLRWDDPNLKYQAESFFDASELSLIRPWFEYMLGVELSAHETELDEYIRWRLVVGKSCGIVHYDKRPGWPFLFGATGFYDLRFAESGPYIDNPTLAQVGVVE